MIVVQPRRRWYAPLPALPPKALPPSYTVNYSRSMFHKLHADLHERDWLVGVPKVKQHLVHEKGCGKLVPPWRWVGSTRPWNPNLNEHFLFHMQPNDESPGADVAHNWSCNTPPCDRVHLHFANQRGSASTTTFDHPRQTPVLVVILHRKALSSIEKPV